MRAFVYEKFSHDVMVFGQGIRLSNYFECVYKLPESEIHIHTYVGYSLSARKGAPSYTHIEVATDSGIFAEPCVQSEECVIFLCVCLYFCVRLRILAFVGVLYVNHVDFVCVSRYIITYDYI